MCDWWDQAIEVFILFQLIYIHIDMATHVW